MFIFNVINGLSSKKKVLLTFGDVLEAVRQLTGTNRKVIHTSFHSRQVPDTCLTRVHNTNETDK